MGMSHGSILSYLSAIRIFLRFLSDKNKDFDQVDKTVLKAYIDYLLDERKVTYPTLKAHFSAISAFYDWLVLEDLVPANPVPTIRKRYLRRYKNGQGLETGGRKLITVEQMARLVNSILNSRDRALAHSIPGDVLVITRRLNERRSMRFGWSWWRGQLRGTGHKQAHLRALRVIPGDPILNFQLSPHLLHDERHEG